MAVAIAFVNYGASRSTAKLLLTIFIASAVAWPLLRRLDKRVTARLAQLKLPDGDYPARISVVVQLEGNPEDVMNACSKAIRNLPNFRSIKEYDAGKRATARTRWSRDSWGEKIHVHVEPGDKGTQLHLESVPALWTVTEDMRLNYQNVALILRSVHGSFGIKDVQPRGYFEDILSS